jgi:hypothetical protein
MAGLRGWYLMAEIFVRNRLKLFHLVVAGFRYLSKNGDFGQNGCDKIAQKCAEMCKNAPK